MSRLSMDFLARSPDNYGGGNQGMRFVGSIFGQEILYSSVSITDTSNHSSSPPIVNSNNFFDQIYAPIKTIILLSTLNQALTVQPTLSVDGVNFYSYGNSIPVNAYSSGSPIVTAVYISSQSAYIPIGGCIVTANIAPTSGTISGSLYRLG